MTDEQLVYRRQAIRTAAIAKHWLLNLQRTSLTLEKQQELMLHPVIGASLKHCAIDGKKSFTTTASLDQ
ncbi:hypothetical protein [Paenibacillus sp. 3LSP]|uniref:hypothetical protein n=1 Tax=Paenibacillus sp. 3LSP TaxID=2800795 RepID=UPI0003AACFEC|nr:hypothetical protein [Paenibacillus sp. 3LSP]